MCQSYPDLKPFVFENDYHTKTIDFANPKAVKALNTALLFVHYRITFWEFPDTNLCPPIPGRVDYIHYLADLLKQSGVDRNINILDIGTGASCIYPILGKAAYNWRFVGTDINKKSLQYAQQIIAKNEFDTSIELRYQMNSSNILKGILKTSDTFSAAMCNPPFYKSETEAMEATTRKLRGLNKDDVSAVRNFSGTHHELWYKGGEKAFIHNYLYESALFKDQCLWFTTLVSKKDLIKGIEASLMKLGATKVKVIDMGQGNKRSRLVAWTFSVRTNTP